MVFIYGGLFVALAAIAALVVVVIVLTKRVKALEASLAQMLMSAYYNAKEAGEACK